MGGVNYSGTRAVPRLELGAALEEFRSQESDFISTKVFPIFRSNKKEAKFSAITRESLAQIADTKRAARGGYNRGSIGAKDKSFACEENGFEMPLDDSERSLYANDFDAEFAAVKAAQGIIQRNQEARIAAALFNTSTFTGSALYTDISSSAPFATIGSNVLGAIRTAKGKVRANCGIDPNALVISATNRDRLLANTDIITRIQYTARATDQEILRAFSDLFGVKYVFIANAIKNSAKEGKDFASADIWSSLYAMLAVVVENGQDLTQPGVGRTFLWTEDAPENVTVESYREDAIRSDVFRVRQHTDEVLIDANFGHLLKVA